MQVGKYKIENNKEKERDKYQTMFIDIKHKIRKLVKDNIANMKKSRELLSKVLSRNLVNIVIKFMDESALVKSASEVGIK